MHGAAMKKTLSVWLNRGPNLARHSHTVFVWFDYKYVENYLVSLIITIVR